MWCAGFAAACARKGSGIHRILLEGVRRAYGAHADVDIILTRRPGPGNACDSYFYWLKPGSDPEAVARWPPPRTPREALGLPRAAYRFPARRWRSAARGSTAVPQRAQAFEQSPHPTAENRGLGLLEPPSCAGA